MTQPKTVTKPIRISDGKLLDDKLVWYFIVVAVGAVAIFFYGCGFILYAPGTDLTKAGVENISYNDLKISDPKLAVKTCGWTLSHKGKNGWCSVSFAHCLMKVSSGYDKPITVSGNPHSVFIGSGEGILAMIKYFKSCEYGDDTPSITDDESGVTG